MNRNEQIIGRGVRNFSHKDLPFSKRNVQIFMHGTILDNNIEESADLLFHYLMLLHAKETSLDEVVQLLASRQK